MIFLLWGRAILGMNLLWDRAVWNRGPSPGQAERSSAQIADEPRPILGGVLLSAD